MDSKETTPHGLFSLTYLKLCWRRGLTALVTLAAATVFAGPACAALTLHIDTTGKTVFATGSDSGITGGEYWGAGGVTWLMTGTANAYSYTNLAGLFTISPGPNLSAIQANNFTNNGGEFALALSTDGVNAPLTITGTGVSVSYAGDSNAETTFANLVGSPIPYAPASGGSGFSSMTVVPEPSGVFLIIFSSMMLLLRRKRHTAHS